MSTSIELSNHTMQPDGLRMVQNIFRRVTAEGYVSSAAGDRNAFARYILRMYFRGMVIEDTLYGLSVAAAKAKFSNNWREAVEPSTLPR